MKGLLGVTPQLRPHPFQLLLLWATAQHSGPLTVFCSLSKAWLPGSALSHPALGPFLVLGIELASLWARLCTPLCSATTAASFVLPRQHARPSVGSASSGMSLLPFRRPHAETAQTLCPQGSPPGFPTPPRDGTAPLCLSWRPVGGVGSDARLGSVRIIPEAVGLWLMRSPGDGRVCKRQGEQGLGVVA